MIVLSLGLHIMMTIVVKIVKFVVAHGNEELIAISFVGFSEVFSCKLILFTDALLFLWCEVVIHLEELSDFLYTLALDQ